MHLIVDEMWSSSSCTSNNSKGVKISRFLVHNSGKQQSDDIKNLSPNIFAEGYIPRNHTIYSIAKIDTSCTCKSFFSLGSQRFLEAGFDLILFWKFIPFIFIIEASGAKIFPKAIQSKKKTRKYYYFLKSNKITVDRAR